MPHLVLDVVVGELQRQPEAGVVHEEVDRVVPVTEPSRDAFDAVLFGQVGRKHLDGHSPLAA